MDAFEQIVCKLLEEEKYWVRHSVKINLTPAEKKLIGKPSAPRPEIDIIALDVTENTVLLLEVKSYLDSRGVSYEEVTIGQTVQEGKYKLLTSENYRQILSDRLLHDWRNTGQVNSDTKITFGLVAGNIYKGREKELREYFTTKDWFFWGPADVKSRIRRLAAKGYEDSIITMIVKLLKS